MAKEAWVMRWSEGCICTGVCWGLVYDVGGGCRGFMPLKMKAGPCNMVESDWEAMVISPVLLVWHVNEVPVSVI